MLLMDTIVQSDFSPAVTEATNAAQERLGDTLSSVYLSGSVAFGEALPGASDVDWYAFLTREPTNEDLEWGRGVAVSLTEKHQAVAKFAFNLNSIDRLRQESTWRFILRYNSDLLSGRDIVGELEAEGIKTPTPGPELARSRIDWLKKLVDATAKGRFSEAVFKLPEDPCLATRKLARWLILVEGAHVLMADNAFVSFRQGDVLDQLERLYPGWAQLFQMTREVLKDPFSALVGPDDFAQEAAAFLRWGIERIPVEGRFG